MSETTTAGGAHSPEAMRITLWSIAVNVGLGLLKVGVGWLGQSKALMADGLHSLVDLSTDVAVVFALLISRRPRDAKHPYGHHKFSSLAQAGIAAAILVFSAGLVISSIRSLETPGSSAPSLLTFLVAIASLGVKEALFVATRKVARQAQSSLILANAWHHRTDSISSLATAVAIGVAHWGGERFLFADSMLAVFLGGYLAFEGARLLFNGINDLLDRAPDEEIINDLREHILTVRQTVAYHDFRARRVGDLIEVDLHLQVPPKLTVEEGHEVAREVRRVLMTRHPEILSVLIHIEPATEEHIKPQGVFDFGETAD